MRILFLIGNGFDINLNLDTSYANVLEDYIKLDPPNEIIGNFQNELKNNKSVWWSDFEYQIGQYIKTFDDNNITDFYAQFSHFREFVVTKFMNEEERIDYTKYKDNIPEIFMNSIASFYITLLDSSKNKILDLIRGNDNVFRYSFITFNYTNALNNIIEISKTFYKDTSFALPITEINNKKYYHHLANIVPVHGTLRKDFIMGVDNVTQINNELLKTNPKLQRTIIKPKTNEILGRNGVKDAERYIRTSKIICIFGMSIGRTDKTWWDHIIKWLLGNDKRHLIIFYFSSDFSPIFPDKYFEVMDKVIDDLFAIINPISDTDKKKIINRIHITPDLRYMFKMNILKKDVVLTSENKRNINIHPMAITAPKAIEQVNQASKILNKSGIKQFNIFTEKIRKIFPF